MKEDASMGSIAGRIACSEGVGAASAGRGQVKYTLRHSDVNQQMFDLDRSTGALIVAGRVDRETKSVYEMEVHALDTGASTNPQSSSVSVRVEVLDVNDNAPRWPDDPVTVVVAEDAVVGSVVYNFTASDADADANAELRYTVVQQGPAAATFSLDPLTGMLTLIEPLDFETTRDHVIVVRATDQAANASERLFTDVTARIAVQDVNDNGPRVVSPAFTRLYVDGSARPGDWLCNVVAVDRDAGDNGRCVYTISAGNDKGTFGIGYDTGALVLAAFPDTAKKHVLNITVADRGTPARHTYLTLEVTFTTSAEQSVQFSQKLYSANVSEDAPVGSFVAKVTANSNDNREYLYISLPIVVPLCTFINTRSSSHLVRNVFETCSAVHGSGPGRDQTGQTYSNNNCSSRYTLIMRPTTAPLYRTSVTSFNYTENAHMTPFRVFYFVFAYPMGINLTFKRDV